jgi:hypothetical protein
LLGPWSYTQSVGLLGRRISPSQSLYIHAEYKQNKRTQTTMPWVGFELTIPVFERAKASHALDRAATVIGTKIKNNLKIKASFGTRWSCCRGSGISFLIGYLMTLSASRLCSVGWAGGGTRIGRGSRPRSHFVHHKSHMNQDHTGGDFSSMGTHCVGGTTELAGIAATLWTFIR